MRRTLRTGFQLFEWENRCSLDSVELRILSAAYERREGYVVPELPMQVHEVLILNGKIEDPAVTGSGAECTWVSERDWIYVGRILMTEEEAKMSDRYCLHLDGIDTLADVYWNGKKIAVGKDVFLPIVAEIDEPCRRENELIVHIHSPHAYLREIPMPERYADKIMPKQSLIRCFHRGYDDYLGFSPYLTRMGIYDQVWLEYGKQGIHRLDVAVQLEEEFETQSQIGCVELELECFALPESETTAVCELRYKGTIVEVQERALKKRKERICLQVEHPELWNVVGRGKQTMYDLSVRLLVRKAEVDQQERKIGFRKLEKTGDFAFQINGSPLRLWGANIAPLDNKTGCYQKDRAKKIVKMALDANMNCLRVWGGGDRLPEDFYEQCDAAGILLWQDFFHDYSMYPEEAEFRALCRQEAEYQIRRLRSHPSILLWCGSNESIMCRDFSNPGQECIGYEIYNEDYRMICHKWDPERYYHISSPSGGNYANDPLTGDTHSYTSTWFVPGGRYPVFLSENMRAYPPVYHSMVRMVGETRLWPDGETGQLCKGSIFPWPDCWRAFTSAESWQKIAHVEAFYDADDAKSMIYRFGAATGRYIMDCVGRYRRGRSYEQRYETERRCRGHLWWKMNTSAPHIYSGLLDYYMEPYLPYYALKRAYQPFQIFFSVDDYIGLWAVNDQIQEVRGTVFLELFDIQKNRSTAFFEISFCVQPDKSLFLADLNRFGQFLMNRHVLHAKAVDETGRLLTEVVDYADVERHMQFPDCVLQLSWEGEELVVETDCFARCVELLGEQDGDYFGWDFSDNYFDLLPGSIRRIRVQGKDGGCIHAKGYYGTKETVISYSMNSNTDKEEKDEL